MERDSPPLCLCPLEGVINTIAKKWAILIITIIGHREPIRFNDIMTALEGISPKTLTDVLKDLQKEGLIERKAFSEIPPRVEYSLTDGGKKLCEAIIPLIRWAEERDNTHRDRCNSMCQSSNCISKKPIRKKNKESNQSSV